MVKKSYRTLFKDPTGFKEKVLYCLFDLDRRIKELTTFDELKQVFSLKTHTHNNLYSKINHNHDMLYSLLTHNHDERYSQVNHIHSDYVTHLELENIARLDHTHNNVCYITPFRVVNGLNFVLCEIEPSDVIFLEDLDNSIFTIKEVRGRYVFFEHDGADPNRIYHLIYYSVITDGQQIPYVNINNITANQGDTVDLYSTVTDLHNTPIDEGTVDYDLDYGDTP